MAVSLSLSLLNIKVGSATNFLVASPPCTRYNLLKKLQFVFCPSYLWPESVLEEVQKFRTMFVPNLSEVGVKVLSEFGIGPNLMIFWPGI